jgi:branched-chain amino acid transport system substrate-binding protein
VSRARLTQVIVLAAAAAVALSACSARDTGTSGDSNSPSAAAPAQAAGAADPKGDGKATCSGITLAYAGTINGESAALGQNILYGVDLAIKQHNTANPGCQVAFKQFDTEGKAEKAPGIVTQIVNEPSILGVVGLPFSGESQAVGNLFNQAKLVQITPSATKPTLSTNGWSTFFRGMGNDNVQGPAAAKFITEKLGAKKVCVIQDDSPYGTGLAESITKALGSAASCADKVKGKQTDFSAVVNKIAGEKPDAVFYAGYYPEAGPLAQQLDDKGVTAKFVGPDGVKDNEFLKGAGNAAAKAYFTCPCVPEDNFKDFNTAYKQIEGHDPGTYSTEGYDVATILLKGIDKGLKDRAALLDFVKNYDGQGLTKKFKWDDKGELTDTPVWSYKVENGKIVNNGQIG